MLFNEFYYHFILEGILDTVPRRVMDMSTSVGELPEQAPYGFWMDKSGNFMPVGSYGHDRALQRITSKAMFYLDDKGVRFRPSGKHRDLLDEGWLRIVINARTIYYQIDPDMELTQSQTKMLNFMKDLYDRQEVLRDTAYDF